MLQLKKLFLFLLFSINFILVACTSEFDDGQRESISATSIDWEYLSKDDNDIRIMTIYIDEKPIENVVLYGEFLSVINENSDYISDVEINDSAKVYIRFNKFSKLTQIYELDEYNGKETTFYIKKEIVADYKE